MHVAWVRYGGRFVPPCALAPPVRVVIWHGCMHEWKGRPVFGIGGTELFLILLFGFLIFGPDKLPAIAKTVGKAISKFRSAQDEMNKVVKTEIYDPLTDDSVKNPMEQIDKENKQKIEKKESFASRKAKYDKERADKVKREAAMEAAKEVRAEAAAEAEAAKAAKKEAEAAAAAAVQAKPGEAGAGIAAATAANAALSAEAAKALSGDAAKAKAKAEELAAATKPTTVHEKVMAARMEATEKAQAEVNAERAAEAELASEILGTAKPAKKKKRPAAADAANESAATQKEE